MLWLGCRAQIEQDELLAQLADGLGQRALGSPQIRPSTRPCWHNLSPLSFLDVSERDYLEGTLAVYELNQIGPLRDVFVWAYERSCQRYTQAREALPAPDPVRFRNREALTEIVNAIVRDELPIDDAPIRPLATPLTTPEDTEQLIAMAFAELHGLHEGNIARHRLRPGEFRRWREHHPTVTRR